MPQGGTLAGVGIDRLDALLAIALEDGDVLDLEILATHHVPLEEYAIFQEKRDGCIKVVLRA